jgi:hypothetical protein
MLLLATLAVVVAALLVLVPRVLKRRAIARALEDAKAGRDSERILDFDEPEAVLGLLEIYAGKSEGRPNARLSQLLRIEDRAAFSGFEGEPDEWIKPSRGIEDRGVPLREAVELLAAGPHREDPGVAFALETLARGGTLEQRFEAHYLLDELAHPTFPSEPEGFSDVSNVQLSKFDPMVVSGPSISKRPLVEELEPITKRTSFEVDAPGGPFSRSARIPPISDRPWRALLRAAQHVIGARVSVDPPPAKRVALERTSNVRLLAGFDGFTQSVNGEPRMQTPYVAVLGVGGLLHRFAYLLKKDVTLIPPAEIKLVPSVIVFDDTDATRVLRALASLNGLEAREHSDKWFVGSERAAPKSR